MGDWNTSSAGVIYQTIGTIQYANSRGTTLNCATANTKGSFGQLTASTEFDAQGILVHMSHPSTNCGALLDIGIGPKDSEQVLIPDLHLDHVHGAGAVPCSSWYFSIEVPANERISARIATSTAATVDTMAVLISKSIESDQTFSRVLTYGKTVVGSRGTSINCGSSVNTKGSWVQIGIVEMNTRMVFISLGSAQNTQLAEADFLMDIGIGLLGVETAVIGNIPFASSAQGDTFFPRTIGPLPCSIPAGQRVSVRGQCSTTDSADRIFDVLLHFIG